MQWTPCTTPLHDYGCYVWARSSVCKCVCVCVVCLLAGDSVTPAFARWSRVSCLINRSTNNSSDQCAALILLCSHELSVQISSQCRCTTPATHTYTHTHTCMNTDTMLCWENWSNAGKTQLCKVRLLNLVWIVILFTAFVMLIHF